MSELPPLRPAERRRVLVIKHGALGDFVQALGPFQAIRAFHLADSVVLLTGSRFAEVAATCGYFDEVWIDDRPPPWRLGALTFGNPGQTRTREQSRAARVRKQTWSDLR